MSQAADKGQSATRKDALVPTAPGGMAFGRCISPAGARLPYR